MKHLAIAVIAAALLWSGVWVWAAMAERRAVTDWAEARRAAGAEVSYADLSVRGFPNRIDTSFTDLRLADPQAGYVWQAPFFQSFRMVYNAGHRIFAFAPDQTVTGPKGETTITSDGLRASLVQDNGEVLRANLEARVLNLGGAHRLALAGMTAALVRQQGTAYHLGLAADAAALPDATLTGALRLDGVVTLDAALAPGLADRPQLTHVDLRLAEYTLGDMALRLTGAAELDAEGRMDGQVTVRADNWRALLALARDSGQIPAAMAEVLEEALTLATSFTATPDRLDLPLTLDRGMARLGPIPLGEAPRLRF